MVSRGSGDAGRSTSKFERVTAVCFVAADAAGAVESAITARSAAGALHERATRRYRNSGSELRQCARDDDRDRVHARATRESDQGLLPGRSVKRLSQL